MKIKIKQKIDWCNQLLEKIDKAEKVNGRFYICPCLQYNIMSETGIKEVQERFPELFAALQKVKKNLNNSTPSYQYDPITNNNVWEFHDYESRRKFIKKLIKQLKK